MGKIYNQLHTGRQATSLSDARLPPDILLVEDEPSEVCLLREAFTTGPLPVHMHSVTSVDQALAFLHHEAPYGQAPRPQLIVTSIRLPGKSGFDLLAEVKRDLALRVIPVIVFSYYNDPETIQKSYALGANRYVVKPEETEAFFKAIHMMVEYSFTVAVLGEPESLLQERETEEERRQRGDGL
jgi:CheY-like chemotaxis protein